MGYHADRKLMVNEEWWGCDRVVRVNSQSEVTVTQECHGTMVKENTSNWTHDKVTGFALHHSQ